MPYTKICVSLTIGTERALLGPSVLFHLQLGTHTCMYTLPKSHTRIYTWCQGFDSSTAAAHRALRPRYRVRFQCLAISFPSGYRIPTKDGIVNPTSWLRYLDKASMSPLRLCAHATNMTQKVLFFKTPAIPQALGARRIHPAGYSVPPIMNLQDCFSIAGDLEEMKISQGSSQEWSYRRVLSATVFHTHHLLGPYLLPIYIHTHGHHPS
ncbi:hypothetical protein B0I35DRAFT_419618 [Stachybotrys elegans]|uniref:Uncharacterized protein n=1 Tax=Stachybotrys elegans TaxID=80388 RepID=A0A8K0WY66_9HYPO|nr:hypothetical protein B0I35DRAFT_419618 [Stachybotrys elegans]